MNLFTEIEARRAIVVQNRWGKEWHVCDPHHMTIRGLARLFPTPRIAAKAARAKGYTVEAGDYNTALMLGLPSEGL